MVEKTPKLYAYQNSNNLLKILVACKATQFNVELVEVENNILRKAVVEESPTNTYPYLVTSEGIVSEASAILYYIGLRGGISGSNDYEKAQVAQWQNFAAYEISTNKSQTLYPIFGFAPLDEKQNKEQLEKLKNNLKQLNTHLNGKKYLLGEQFSVADIDLWAELKHFWQLVFVEPMRLKLFPHIEEWFKRVASLDAVVGVYGLTLLCKVAQRAPKVEKPKEEKHEEKKADQNKEKKDDDAEEEDDAAEKERKEQKKKEKDFPESTFDFDKFKFDFSNTKDKKPVLDNLLTTTFDRNAFSIYYIRYQKLDSEGKELWLTENGRNSFLERVDSYRKHVFSNLGIYGDEGNYEIKGVWFWRGKGVPFFMDEHPTFEFYDKRELDPSKEEDRKVIESYWLTVNKGDIVEGLPLSNNVFFK